MRRPLRPRQSSSRNAGHNAVRGHGVRYLRVSGTPGSFCIRLQHGIPDSCSCDKVCQWRYPPGLYFWQHAGRPHFRVKTCKQPSLYRPQNRSKAKPMRCALKPCAVPAKLHGRVLRAGTTGPRSSSLLSRDAFSPYGARERIRASRMKASASGIPQSCALLQTQKIGA